MRRHVPLALALLALLLAPLALVDLTTTTQATAAPPELARAVENTRPQRWLPGDWWAFSVTFQDGKARSVALVVHEARPDGFRLGSNVSSGFFGLPFSGNVTRDLNPEVGGEEWPMFRFPLSDGMTWTYAMLGHEASATARAGVVDAPGVGEHPGFHVEASSYGQVFARYDYSPVAGWLTRLELIEPSTRVTVLDARLEGFGARYGRGYFVEEPLGRVRLDYPQDAPGELRVEVPSGYHGVRATLVAQTPLGLAMARVVDADGRDVLDASRAGKGAAMDRETLRVPRGATWTLRHAGTPEAVVTLEVMGLAAVSGPGAALPGGRLVVLDGAGGDDDPGSHGATAAAAVATMAGAVDDPSSSGGASQRILPVRPQTGHVTSTGWPVAV